MSEQWFIMNDGQSQGPYSLVEVFNLIDQQQVAPAAWFTCGGVRVDRQTLLERWPDPRVQLTPVEDAPEPVVTEAPQTPPPIAPPAPAAEPAKPADAPPPSGVSEERPVVERDSILVLGRRRAGKTIYLATLYAALWKSAGGLTMKALSGAAHKTLMGIVEQLKRGEWPEATLGTRQMEFELDDQGRKRLLVALDYSGEDFRRAFVDEDLQSPEVKKLLGYLERSMAVILLMDPAVAVKGAPDEIVDDDFGMVQAVEHIRNWPGGDKVPIVLALTKIDQTREFIRETGKMRDFIQRHYPALLRTYSQLSIFGVSAVQEELGANGQRRPRPDSVPTNVEKPLLHCLQLIRQEEDARRRHGAQLAAERTRQALVEQEEQRVRATNRRLAFLIAGLLILGLCVCTLVWFLRE